MLCTIPLSIFQLVVNATGQPLDPWVSWGETHYNFSRVRLIPAVLWNTNHWSVIGIQFSRWSGPFCAFVFFAFFGFAAEARKNYRSAISEVLNVCRLKRGSSPPQKTSPRSVALPRTSLYPLTLLSSLRKLTLGSSSTVSPTLPVYTPPPLYYKSTNSTTTPTSLGDKDFVPLASSGTVSEFTVSASASSCENPFELELPSRVFVESLSSRASSRSVVDYVV